MIKKLIAYIRNKCIFCANICFKKVSRRRVSRKKSNSARANFTDLSHSCDSNRHYAYGRHLYRSLDVLQQEQHGAPIANIHALPRYAVHGVYQLMTLGQKGTLKTIVIIKQLR